MPKIPQIIADVRPEPAQQPGGSIGIAEQPGEAAARFGEALTSLGEDISQKQIELRRSRQVIQASSSAALDADQFIQSQMSDPDFATFPDRVQAGLKTIQDTYAKQIKDPQANAAFLDSFDRLTTSQVLDARHEVHRRELQSDAAALEDSLGTYGNLAVERSGPALDGVMAQAKGAIDSRVAGGVITPEVGRLRWKQFGQDVSNAKALNDIRNDPAQAFKDLSSGAYPLMDETKRQEFLNEALTQARVQQREADEAAKKQTEQAVATMTSQALNGTLTHPSLEDASKKFPQMTGDQYEHLYDLIDKPHQSPSDPDTVKVVTLAVRSITPTITKSQLADLYRSGKLNLEDYTKLDNELTSNQRYADEQGKEDLHYRQTQAEQIISSALKSDPAIEAAARQELNSASAATGGMSDPLAVAPGIVKKYQPIIDALGGISESSAQSQFNSARTSYMNAVQAQQKWASGFKGTIANTFEHNPYDDRVLEFKSELINKARTAGRLTGIVAKEPDGTRKIINGHSFLVVGGQVIAE